MVAHAPLNAAALPAHAVPAYAVEVRGLTKTYQASGKAGPKQALKGIDLAIPRGAVFGLRPLYHSDAADD
ncbi:hypothetical protein GBZ26_18640, partial [Azospirillum formosense]|nr:hypothetical protein [Azospirillum formosense]